MRGKLGTVNVRDLIEMLNDVADDLPDGLDSTVLVHCVGREDGDFLTDEVEVTAGRQGEGPHHVLLRAHRHDDGEETPDRQVTMAVHEELPRLTAGDPLPRAGLTVTIGDTGDGVRIPYGEGGRPMLPGSPEAVAAGCICDPEKNDHGRGVRTADDGLTLVADVECDIHQRVTVDLAEMPPKADDA